MTDRMNTEILPDFECACATARRAARLVTQLYDEEFRGHLEASQFALLSAIEQQSGCNQSMLARALGLDKTTLSRNLTVLARRGWVERQAVTDQRERGFRLTPAGRGLLKTARPAWKRAQARLRSAMSGEQWDQMRQMFRVFTNASYQALKKEGVA
jgi:DNA-binding MarR family transcriptional regulator